MRLPYPPLITPDPCLPNAEYHRQLAIFNGNQSYRAAVERIVRDDCERRLRWYRVVVTLQTLILATCAIHSVVAIIDRKPFEPRRAPTHLHPTNDSSLTPLSNTTTAMTTRELIDLHFKRHEFHRDRSAIESLPEGPERAWAIRCHEAELLLQDAHWEITSTDIMLSFGEESHRDGPKSWLPSSIDAIKKVRNQLRKDAETVEDVGGRIVPRD